jgi:hypothetical protein
MLLLHERELPENAPRQGIWLPRLQQAELGEFTGPHIARYSIVGRRVWYNRYVPPPARHPFTSACSAPTHSMSRSSSSDGRFIVHSTVRSAPYPPPARSTNIVIRDAGGSSSVPPRREKKEELEEEEWEQIPPELLEET